ncbi:MAG TPA: alpha/beta fold hydrolase [Acidimicrobiales bacterium]|nr:alpha/beta fold hydrolase [Acidimicrobiales bacterium]
MHDVIESGGLRLTAHVARPPSERLPIRAGLVLCHGFPAGPRSPESSSQSYPQLADRLAADAGWTVLSFNFRGTGGSGGDFSLNGWIDDVRAAVDHLLEVEGVDAVWLAGASTGGSAAICAAAEDERVRGVAALSARADFDDWAAHPKRFLQHAREIGVIRDPLYPANVDAWIRQLKETRPLAYVAKLAPRPLLLIQGSDDDVVPSLDARALADCHGQADLRIINGAGHTLRHDPRAIAILLGWLERQLPTSPADPEEPDFDEADPDVTRPSLDPPPSAPS